MALKWYSLRALSGKEKKIRDAILHEAALANLQEIIVDVLVPSENVVEMRGGKKYVRNKVFFPGYIMIQMELTKVSRYLIENTPGVMSFVGPKGEPTPLKEDEIRRILGEVEERDGKEILGTPYAPGDPIKIIDGPFIDFSGFVKEIDETKQKVKVEVSIFGRPTPVELDYLQIEMEK